MWIKSEPKARSNRSIPLWSLPPLIATFCSAIGKSVVNKGGVVMEIITVFPLPPLSLSLSSSLSWKNILADLSPCCWARCKRVAAAAASDCCAWIIFLFCFLRCFWKVTKLCTHSNLQLKGKAEKESEGHKERERGRASERERERTKRVTSERSGATTLARLWRLHLTPTWHSYSSLFLCFCCCFLWACPELLQQRMLPLGERAGRGKGNHARSSIMYLLHAQLHVPQFCRSFWVSLLLLSML